MQDVMQPRILSCGAEISSPSFDSAHKQVYMLRLLAHPNSFNVKITN